MASTASSLRAALLPLHAAYLTLESSLGARSAGLGAAVLQAGANGTGWTRQTHWPAAGAGASTSSSSALPPSLALRSLRRPLRQSTSGSALEAVPPRLPYFSSSLAFSTSRRGLSGVSSLPASPNHLSLSAARSLRYFTSSPARLNASTTTSSSSSTSSAADQIDESDQSLKGRLKTLMKKYGWATVAIYLLFSVVDFGLVYLAITLIGAEHVRKGQDYVLDYLVYGRQLGAPSTGSTGTRVDEGAPEDPDAQGVLSFLKEWREKHKAEERQAAKESKKSGSSGVWATAALAYAIHKTLLLPFRIGATAAATPAIVKQLQKWGINIARAPIPESVKQRGKQSIKSGRDRLDKARGRHGDWL